MSGRGTAARGAALARLGERVLLVLLLATGGLIARAQPAHAYAFLLVPGSGGTARRWDQSALPDGRVPWRISDQVGTNVTGDRAPTDVISAAFDAWDSLPDCSIRFAFAGTTKDRNRHPGDGVNAILLDSQEELGAGVLAATFLSSDAQGRIMDADIVFNPPVSFTTSNVPEPDKFDLQEIATHEIGHLIGLEHTGVIRATMVPFSDHGEAQQRTPESDDQIGASLLYPDGGFPSRTGAIEGRVSLLGGGVFLAQVVATNLAGRLIAAGLTLPDGSYRIAGLPPDLYVVFAEPLDGPVQPASFGGFAVGFGGGNTAGYSAAFH